ncbi:hypothetical protein [Paraconexibacter algicola]|nr:hypothetical protein [Paraconexibacter algicola]
MFTTWHTPMRPKSAAVRGRLFVSVCPTVDTDIVASPNQLQLS